MSLKKLKIIFTKLLFALESTGTPDLQHYLDTETGEVFSLHDDFPDAEEIRERIEEGPLGRYKLIEALDSRESFQMMEDFVESLPESRRRAQLLEAISRNKPFRRFRDIVHSDIALRNEWFAYRDEALAVHAREWLETLGIEAEPVAYEP
jgi:hypothetical protein